MDLFEIFYLNKQSVKIMLKLKGTISLEYIPPCVFLNSQSLLKDVAT